MGLRCHLRVVVDNCLPTMSAVGLRDARIELLVKMPLGVCDFHVIERP